MDLGLQSSENWFLHIPHRPHNLTTFRNPDRAPQGVLDQALGHRKGKGKEREEDTDDDLEPKYALEYAQELWDRLKTLIQSPNDSYILPRRISPHTPIRMVVTTTAFINTQSSAVKRDWRFVFVGAFVEPVVVENYRMNLFRRGTGWEIRAQLSKIYEEWGFQPYLHDFPWVDGITLDAATVQPASQDTQAMFAHYSVFNQGLQEDQAMILKMAKDVLGLPISRNDDGEVVYTVHKALRNFLRVSKI
jgi:hypothetical protein